VKFLKKPDDILSWDIFMGAIRGAGNTFANFFTIGLNRASIAIYLAAHQRQKVHCVN